MITFTLTDEQEAKFLKWQKNKKKKNGGKEPYAGAVGGAYSFNFIPTGLGVIEIIKCIDGAELNVTEFDKW